MMDEKEILEERYELAKERITWIVEEEMVPTYLLDYFKKTASLLGKIIKNREVVDKKELFVLSLEDLSAQNQAFFEELLEENYSTSYGNPAYAKKVLGKYGEVLCFLYTELRGLIPYSFENRIFDITIGLELFIEVYHYFQEEGEDTLSCVRSAIYYYVSDYSDRTIFRRVQELLDPKLSFARDIIMDCDLEDLRYLYYFGEYITDNERKTAKFLNQLSQEEIDRMASTFTEGFRKGFVNNRIDLSKKKVVNIRYHLGFERMVKAAIEQFLKMGLQVTIYRAAVTSIHKKQHLKIGYYGTSPNRQFEYDHRFDEAVYLDKALIDRRLVNVRVAYDKMKDLAKVFAGPALLEVFGEKLFQPEQKDEASQMSEKQKKLVVRYQRESAILVNEYIKGEETSFTIISFPIPEVGKNFEEIFRETLVVNTLDSHQYEEIQQKLIDTLDQGEYVQVLGAGANRTHMKINLHQIHNPNCETNFENCLADINIPLGEVFTSPLLNGTNGTLHIGKIYLGGLKYVDLEFVFENGKIVDYTCNNFQNQKDNKEFVKENLMFHHETLPLGEFAIGTNTFAYVMGKKYNISHLLPVLIAEKTGPHFAVGDTCYKMSEDLPVFNPDGKEIIARENECSALRKEDMEKAYFNCHTDITLPYDEIDEISVYTREGKKILLLKEGRFVLQGTEKLNIPLDEWEQS